MSFKDDLKQKALNSISANIDKLLNETAEKGLYSVVLTQTMNYDLLLALNQSPDREVIIDELRLDGITVNINQPENDTVKQILFDWSK